MQHKTINSSHGTTHYWISSKKSTTIVFTHGALMDHQLFNPQIDYFKEFYTVIVWDVPAHGQSRPYGAFSLSNACRELCNILEQEDIKHIHLVGQSMGGYIGQIFAKDYSNKVKSLTTIGSSPLRPQYYSALDNLLLFLTPTILRLYPYQLLIKTIARQISNSQSGQIYALQVLEQSSKSEIAKVMKEVYVGVKEYLQDAPLQVPVFITYGDSDTTGKVKAYCQKWATSEEHFLQVIPNAAHNANWDNPDYFNQALNNFLNEKNAG